MIRPRLRRAGLLAAAVLLSLAAPAARAAAQPAAPPAALGTTLVVRRAGGDSVVLTAAQLGALPRREVDATEHGRAAHFAGVPLQDVLRAAGVRSDSLRGAALATVLVAEAADGYRVAFALGELAPDLGARAVLVADRRDGAPLGPSEGPLRLIVPGDQRPARWLRQLRALVVRAAAPAPPNAAGHGPA
ncbi:hypothetical protein tb265_41810 [Gemmatimonadetes bacterium T265]|nr:hypothetical protein tb265_41810 [Gemmatimonadetes bacterium T265]